MNCFRLAVAILNFREGDEFSRKVSLAIDIRIYIRIDIRIDIRSVATANFHRANFHR
jgi:hypothetical protein